MSTRIVLSMIVKDEAAVIERALRSVRGHVQAWAICDTGSSDATRELIRAALVDLPGRLEDQVWVDFAHNRNQALALAREFGDYALILDADEELVAPKGLPVPDGEVDLYWLRQRAEGAPDMDKPRILRNDGSRLFKGVLHEAIDYAETDRHRDLSDCWIRVHPDGGRSNNLSQREKYLRDAATLESALQREPDNTRYVYYLGMSYAFAGEKPAAIRWLRRRTQMSQGFAGEIFDAWMRLGAYAEADKATGRAEFAYRQAARTAPFRADPLVALARLGLTRGEWSIAYALAIRALEPPEPKDGMFVDTALYRMERQRVFAECAMRAGDHQRAARWLEKWLQQPGLGVAERQLFLGLLQRARAG